MRIRRFVLPLLAAVTLTIAPLTVATAKEATVDSSLGDQEAWIVILSNQHPELSARNAQRAQTLRGEQASIVARLRQVRAQQLKAFTTVNAVAAKLTVAAAQSLAASPGVLAVIPDVTIKGPVPAGATRSKGSNAAGRASSSAATVCPSNPNTPILEPEALQVTNTDFGNPSRPSAHSLGIDGTGVKVAFMADGVDTTLPDFQRANGTPVFSDYQDFSSDGTAAPTFGAEAIGDASSIAAQGRFSYDLSQFVNAAHPLPAGCTIRVLGMAPGASLVGLKVFTAFNATTTSGFLQAIDYAVNVAHVDVINQSFGANPFPDTAADAIRLADEMAVNAGVTVTVSSGDSGINSTIGSPATDPAVIDVGGSTTWRSYAQATYSAIQFGNGRFASNNISSLSSGGFAQNGRTVDLVAPGDLGWSLCSPNVAMFVDCVGFNGQPSSIQLFGGTSESAPLTAGAAALVIQAYRQTHGGTSPSPALVKQILISTATDIGAPAEQQGAGLLNTLGAVRLAESIHDSNGSPAAKGHTLLISPNQVDKVALPGTAVTFPVYLTNTGTSTQTVELVPRALTDKIGDATGQTSLDTTSTQTFLNWAGVPEVYTINSFKVKRGADRLLFSADYQAHSPDLRGRVRYVLFDPSGTEVGYSLPQGVANYGHVEVRNPAGGTWRVLFFTTASSHGTTGPIQWEASAYRYDTVGSVSPGQLVIAPGATRSATVSLTTPAAPGDMGVSIAVTQGDEGGAQTTIPVVLRSLVPLGPTGGTFTGVLTGGNGRPGNVSQMNTYFFNVPSGQNDLDVSLALAHNPLSQVLAYLIDPRGQTLAFSSNFTLSDPNGVTLTAQLYHRLPMGGQWRLVLQWAEPVSGQELAQSFNGTIGFNQVDIHAAGLPSSASTILKAGVPVTVAVTVHNTGIAPQAFFADPRLTRVTALALSAFPGQPNTGLTLPLGGTSPTPAFFVPAETSRLLAGAQTGVPALPVTFDFGLFVGDPDIPASTSGTTASGKFSAPEVTPGFWFVNPAEVGPFGAGGAPITTGASVSLTARTQAFDPAVTSSTDDLWRGAVDPTIFGSSSTFNPTVIPAGGSGPITVIIKPQAKKGTLVTGILYIDDVTYVTALGVGIPYGDELVALPYQYTVG